MVVNKHWLRICEEMSAYSYASCSDLFRLKIERDRKNASVNSNLVDLIHQSQNNISPHIMESLVPMTVELVLVKFCFESLPEIVVEELDGIERSEEIEVVPDLFEHILLKDQKFGRQLPFHLVERNVLLAG